MHSQGESEQLLADQVATLAQTASLAFIAYMRFARRARGVAEARSVFRNARKSPLCTNDVFVAAALMEFHAFNNVHVARKIFELGFLRFAEREPQYVLRYLDFLTHLNDDASAKRGPFLLLLTKNNEKRHSRPV